MVVLASYKKKTCLIALIGAIVINKIDHLCSTTMAFVDTDLIWLVTAL